MSPWSRDLPVGAARDWLLRRKAGLLIVLGVALRLVDYARGRSYWLDEASLVACVREMSPGGIFGQLGRNQLAPPGFVAAMKAASGAFGEGDLAYRLPPLLGGIASMFLFAAIARRVLTGRAVLVALALFAVSGDLVYFASEAKQYSTDVTAALACLLLGLTVGARPLTTATAAGLAAAGAGVAWFSHPSAFTLAAVGTVGLARSIGARDARSTFTWVLVGVAWVGSIAGVHAVAMVQLDNHRAMWGFWTFAFPPMPPRSLRDLAWIPRRVLFLFVEPLNFDAPFGPACSMIPAAALAVLGFVRIGRADRARLALLLLPGAFALLAASLKLYPFHGRQVLFLAPTLLLAVAGGLEWFGESRGRGLVYALLATMILGFPALTAARRVIDPPWRDFNPRGDLRPSSLDPDRFPF